MRIILNQKKKKHLRLYFYRVLFCKMSSNPFFISQEARSLSFFYSSLTSVISISCWHLYFSFAYNLVFFFSIHSWCCFCNFASLSLMLIAIFGIFYVISLADSLSLLHRLHFVYFLFILCMFRWHITRLLFLMFISSSLSILFRFFEFLR